MDAATMPLQKTMPLQMIGGQDAASCDGDVCAIPVHHEQAVVNRALDSDRV